MRHRSVRFALVVVALAGAMLAWFLRRGGERVFTAAESQHAASVVVSRSAQDAALDTETSLIAANVDEAPRDAAAAPVAPKAFDPNAASYVVGTLSTTSGAPLADGDVEIVVSQLAPGRAADEAAPGPGVRVRRDVSNMRTAVVRDGRYRAGPVWPGPCSLYVHGDAIGAQKLEFDVPALPGEIRRDLVLELQRVVHVRVRTPGGEPFARALIFAEDLLPPFPLQIVASREPLPLRALESEPEFDLGWLDAHESLNERVRTLALRDDVHDATASPGASEPVGRFALDLRRVRDGDDFIGELIVPAIALQANVLWRGQPIGAQPLAADAVELVVELERGRVRSALSSLRVFVVDAADHQPIANARIVAGRIGATLATALTDADGACTLADLPAGRVLVGASAGERAPVSRWCELPVAGRAELGELALAATRNLNVRARDPRGVFVRHAIEVGEAAAGGVEPGFESAVTETTSAWPAGRCLVRSEQYALVRATPSPVYTAELERALVDALERDRVGRGGFREAGATPAVRVADSGGHRFLVDETTRFERLCLPPTLVDTRTAVDGEIVLDLVPGTACDLELGLARERAVLVRITTRAGLPVLEQVRSGDATVRAVLAPGDYAARVTEGARLVGESAFTVAHERVVVRLR